MIGAAAIMVTLLTACNGGSSTATSTTSTPSTTAATTTSTVAVSSTTTTTLATTTTTAAVNYGQQFLSDVAGWDSAVKAAAGDGLSSTQARAAGQQAVKTAQLLLTQSWPAADAADIHTLAVQFDVINEDIQADDLNKYSSDGTQLNADANVVRAEVGLPAIK
jgi:hypothetical protein